MNTSKIIADQNRYAVALVKALGLDPNRVPLEGSLQLHGHDGGVTVRTRDGLYDFDGDDLTSEQRKAINEYRFPSPEPENPTATVLGEIAIERRSQDAKWGEQNHPDGTGPYVKNPDRMTNMEDQRDVARSDCQEAAQQNLLNWMLILREEVYEAFAERDLEALRTELVQVAAVAVAWVEAIDRRAPDHSMEEQL